MGAGSKRDPAENLSPRKLASSPQRWNCPGRHDGHKQTIKGMCFFHSFDGLLMTRVSGRWSWTSDFLELQAPFLVPEPF
ncbi:hypothetical protein HLI_05775 [Halobacillus litoralis]|uniref:Uncharacterized protein n=1 Tax=Halobacillus litoralis TaxID=45668 RepID=A0A410MAS7_9BACI|nr:hypothetical protein HLI_05775 [Halobacillus litoralis]